MSPIGTLLLFASAKVSIPPSIYRTPFFMAARSYQQRSVSIVHYKLVDYELTLMVYPETEIIDRVEPTRTVRAILRPH